MKRKFQLVFFSCIFFLSMVNAQDNIVVAVDGFFTNKDSSYVLNHLGPDFVKEIVNIPPDSSQVLLGEIGKFGIINIVTMDRRSKKSKYFQLENNLLFELNPIYFLNDKEVNKSMIEVALSNPSKLVSVNIIAQLESIQMYGKEKKGGVVLVTTKQE